MNNDNRKIHLKIVTHEKIVYEKDVDAVYTKGVNGVFGVLVDHVPFMSALDIGVTKVINGDEVEYITTMGGAFQVKENQATILTDTAELGKDIDIERVLEAKKRAEKRLAKTESSDVPRAEMALARAMARLKATQRI